MNVALVFPVKEQGSDAFWNNVENDGFKTIDHIPKSLISRMDNTKMKLTLKNGSTFQILGASEPDTLRGANAKIYILSEFVDIPTAVMKVIRPVVAVNGGQIIIISTPKIDGISGASFKNYFDRALKNLNQYASRVTADQYLSAEILEELRQEAISEYGNDFSWRQEYMCDWGQVSSSSYYGSALKKVQKHNRIGEFPYNPAFPAFTVWDLGMSDSTAITIFQYYGKRVYIIDYFEISNAGYESITRAVQTKPYNFLWHFFPHDGAVRDSDAVQRVQKYRDAGLVNIFLIRKEAKDVGIKRAVGEIANACFNKATTLELLRKLLLYKKKFNPVTGDYLGPEHKTESHAADTVRYLYGALSQFFNKETGEFLFSPESTSDTYESETVLTPAQFRLGG